MASRKSSLDFQIFLSLHLFRTAETLLLICQHDVFYFCRRIIAGRKFFVIILFLRKFRTEDSFPPAIKNICWSVYEAVIHRIFFSSIIHVLYVVGKHLSVCATCISSIIFFQIVYCTSLSFFLNLIATKKFLRAEAKMNDRSFPSVNAPI